MTVANAITLLRMALTVVFGVLWWRGAHVAALSVFAAAALSDIADGFFARLLNQRTRLGQVLDPAADKLMLLVSFLVAAALGAVPLALAVLVIGRDVVLVAGGALFAFVLRGRLGPERWKPSRIGKYATFTQVLTIGLALLHCIVGGASLRPWVGALVIICAALTTIAGVQYVAAGVRALSSARLASGGAA
jgi:cardiolipin synthase